MEKATVKLSDTKGGIFWINDQFQNEVITGNKKIEIVITPYIKRAIEIEKRLVIVKDKK